MTNRLPHILSMVVNEPLMVHPGKAKAFMIGLGGRLVEGGVVFGDDGISTVNHSAGDSMGKLTDQIGRAYDRAGRAPYEVVDNVAVIPVEGTLVHKGAYIGQSSGQMSYEGLQAQITRAGKDDRVKGIVYEFDTFGGVVNGAFATAELMRRVSAQKPTMAILTDNAASAGYLLASQQRQIVMPTHGTTGSIGVVTMHADFSKKLENEGVRVTILTAGSHKADGNEFEPLPDEVRERILARAERTRQTFAAAVEAGRGRRLTAAQALATQGATLDDSEALKLGLIDAVAYPNDAFAEFVAAVNRAR